MPEGNPKKKHNPGNPGAAEAAVDRLLETVRTLPGRYNDGCQETTKDVIGLGSSAEAEAAWKAAVIAAAEKMMRSKGLKDFGSTSDWKDAVKAKSDRWSSGVAAAEEKIKRKFAVIIPETLEAAGAARDMPKGPKGSGANKSRMIKYFDERVRLAEARRKRS